MTAWIRLLVGGISSVTWGMQKFPQMHVTEHSARILDMQGNVVCSVPRGTKLQPQARDEQSEKILVDVKHAGCPASGVVEADSIDFMDTDREADSEATVAKQGAHMRSAPDLKPGTVKCSLRLGTDLEIMSDEPEGKQVPFYKVKLHKSVAGCPKEGYVASNLLEPGDPYGSLTIFDPADPTKRRSQAEADCKQCTDDRRRNLEKSGKEIKSAIRRGSYQQQVAKALTEAAHRGVGHVGKSMCYKGVKRIIAAARVNGKKIGDPSKVVGNSALNAMTALPKAGWKNDYPAACHDAGALLVYEGPAHAFLNEYNRGSKKQKAAIMTKVRRFMLQHYGVRATAGDLHGHIEMLGTDGKYHHFLDSKTPISQSRLGANGRRKLVGCFIAQ